MPPMKTNQHFPVEKGGGSGSVSSQLGKLIGLFDKIYNFSLFGVLNRSFLDRKSFKKSVEVGDEQSSFLIPRIFSPKNLIP